MSVISRRTAAKPSEKNDVRHDAARQFAEGQAVFEGACHHLEENSGGIRGLACHRVRSVFEVEGQVPLDLDFTLEGVTAATKEAMSCKVVLSNVLNSVRGL